MEECDSNDSDDTGTRANGPDMIVTVVRPTPATATTGQSGNRAAIIPKISPVYS